MTVAATTLTAGREPVVILGEMPGITLAQRCLFDAWAQQDLRPTTLLAVHALVCPEQSASPGRIREENVVVRLNGEVRFRAPHASRVEPRMEGLVDWLVHALSSPQRTAFPVDLAAEFSWRLSNTHPFQDGNGRVSRAVSTWLIATCRYGVVRPRDLRRYLYAEPSVYYDALRSNDAGDAAPWHRLFAEAVTACLLPETAWKTWGT